MSELFHHGGVRYQLPEDIPVTWSSSTEVRIGGSHIGLILPDHPAIHAMLSSLKLGTDVRFLHTLAKAHGLDREQIDHIVTGLISISVPVTAPAPAKARVVVRTAPASVSFAQVVAREFSRRHHEVALVGANHEGALANSDLVVEIGEFVIPTRRYLSLLSADIPHLNVVRDAGGLQVGPLVIPGATPCLRCDDLWKLAKHPEWPAVATQLADRPPATLPIEVEWLGALQVGLLGAAFFASRNPRTPLGLARQLIDATSGEITVIPRSFHDGCGCRVPQDSETELPPRAGTTAAGIVALV